MNRIVFSTAFAIGLAAVVWVAWGFVGHSGLALAMTAAIAAVYLIGSLELQRFRVATATLSTALADMPQPLPDLGAWLNRLDPSLQNPVRLRIEGERVALPGPALTPYLVGLLVMLGMLGTFLGMVVTFKGAVFALEGSSDLQTIRAALSAPIKGLGLSFGTSVAGVAASAMLGLISALSRRERMQAARLLDARMATVLRPFSLGHQRQQTFQALQMQAEALPEVVHKLQALMEGLERRNDSLNQQLLGQQQQFHREVSVAYGELAQSVGVSLKDSLTAGAKAAGEGIQPVVASAMAEVAQQAQRTHERLVDVTQAQLSGLASQFEATARTASESWAQALQTHAQSSAQVVDGFARQSAFLVASVQEATAQSQSVQAAAEQQRLDAWARTLEATATTLVGDWQRVGAQTLDQQQAVCEALARTAGQITAQSTEQTARAMADMTQLLVQSETLMRQRIESEGQWMGAQGERMDQLTQVWRTELAALRDAEAQRGQAAVDRLGELQAALASHLATLGSALEAPMNRMLQTASEVPQAAAEVIAPLRQEMSRLTERDNTALAERNAMMAQMHTLLQSVQQAAGQQQTMIESMVSSAAEVLERAGAQLSESLEAQAGKVAEVAAHVTASAVELASLGEAFSHGVQLFSATNDKLIDSLQGIESAIGQSLSRSDEQLAYYVAQAREVIDLSIASQQGIVEDLRRLHGRQAALADGGAR